MPRTIFIVPGFYEGSASFEPLKEALTAPPSGEDKPLEVHITELPSTGTTPHGNPNMTDDSLAIAKHLSEVVDATAPATVLAVMHSAGGFLGSAALEGLTVGARKAAGKEGGVEKVVFLTGAVMPKGMMHQPLPFMDWNADKSAHLPVDPLNTFFHDLPASEAAAWNAKLRPQPGGWDREFGYEGFRDVPSVYIFCEDDRVLPPPFQEQFVQMTGAYEVRRIKAGHMAQLSRTEEVATIVRDVAEGRI